MKDPCIDLLVDLIESEVDCDVVLDETMTEDNYLLVPPGMNQRRQQLRCASGSLEVVYQRLKEQRRG